MNARVFLVSIFLKKYYTNLDETLHGVIILAKNHFGKVLSKSIHK